VKLSCDKIAYPDLANVDKFIILESAETAQTL